MQESLKEEVVCPICQKTAMDIENVFPYGSCIVCHRCHIRIPANITLQNLGLHIQSRISDHSSTCSSEPQFQVASEDDGMHMYMLCAHCSYLSIIS
jgi:hypothetical protein